MNLIIIEGIHFQADMYDIYNLLNIDVYNS